jgi:NAD(P)-dependent dehydrogenase (short-subunit alcohol dehydrogenase family)
MDLRLGDKVTRARGVDGRHRQGDSSLSRSLAELTKGTAVTVTTVLPGSTSTEGVARFVQDIFPGIPLEQAERRFMQENRPTSLIERLIIRRRLPTSSRT